MTSIDSDERFFEGVQRFNERRFWDAHEAWEELWLAAEGTSREFLQGLIQLAAAYHHVQRGTLRGGIRLFDSAMRRLSAVPIGYAGVDRSEAQRAALRDRQWAAGALEAETKPPYPHEFPRLILLNIDVAAAAKPETP
ncbi:MAG TPA: DUF309 domain-containing protein [Thermoanaerobaculia bacterium]|nr:DUF309 domain-containing protein [Thermoanaerobaculia bacterium]